MAKMNNAIEAELELKRWHTLLPTIKSAYQPSGKTTFLSLKSMSIGALMGLLWGIVPGLAISILVLIIGILVRFLYLFSDQGKIPLIGLLMWGLALIGFLLYLIMFSAVGLTCASQVISRLDKNRNTLIASLFAIASTLGTTFIIVFGFHSIPWTGNLRAVSDVIFNGGDGGWLAVYIAGSFIAVLASVLNTVFAVKERKYCEICNCLMTQNTLRALKYESLIACINSKSPADLVNTIYHFQGDSEGNDGVLNQYICSKCGSSYLEVETHFHASWTVGNGEKISENTKSESWIIASYKLSSNDTKKLKAIVGKHI